MAWLLCLFEIWSNFRNKCLIRHLFDIRVILKWSYYTSVNLISLFMIFIEIHFKTIKSKNIESTDLCTSKPNMNISIYERTNKQTNKNIYIYTYIIELCIDDRYCRQRDNRCVSGNRTENVNIDIRSIRICVCMCSF